MYVRSLAVVKVVFKVICQKVKDRLACMIFTNTEEKGHNT